MNNCRILYFDKDSVGGKGLYSFYYTYIFGIYILIQGSLIEETFIDWSELKCDEPKTAERVNIPVLFKAFSKANEACNKFEDGSITSFKVRNTFMAIVYIFTFY